MIHPAEEEIEAYLAGTLGDADRAILESHLTGCAECALEVEEWEALFAALSDLPYLEPSPGFADRVLSGLRIEEPWYAKIVAFLNHFRPNSNGGWLLVFTLISLPVLTMGGAITWLISRPWLSLDALWIFVSFHIEAFLVDTARGTLTLILESRLTFWLVEGIERALGSIGVPGIGVIAVIGALLVTLSVWTLYRNLFRDTTRGGSHVTT